MDILSEEQRATAKNLIEQQIAEYLTDLPAIVKRVLHQATLDAMGIREVNGAIKFNRESDWLAKKIKRRLEMIDSSQNVRKTFKSLIERAIKDPELQQALQETIYSTYRKNFIETISSHIRIKANEDAKKAIAQLVKHISFNPLQDPADPNSYNSPLGEIVLQDLAKQISNGERLEELDDIAEGTASASPSPGPDDDDIPF